jgi:multidrug transporter EmrE-like cation transporter
MGYLYVAGTILFTVYGQLILKWQVSQAGAIPSGTVEKLWFFLSLLLNPWIISGFAGAFLAALCWMAAVSKLDLSHAYPFMSMAFVLVLILSNVFFAEPITPFKIVGMAFIVLGIIVGSQG